MIYALPSVRSVLSALSALPAGAKTARTLAGTRCVDFPNDQQDKDWRRRTATAIKDGAIDSRKLTDWRRFAVSLAGNEQSPGLVFASQQSRLMVNMAGGVFENGGLCLDRTSGIPIIPGSAVKGCARRLALAALREWSTGQLTPGDSENLLAAAIEGSATSEDFLFHLGLIFGWCDLEWKGREDFRDDREWEQKRPDFAWACADDWNRQRKAVADRLCVYLHIKPKSSERPWESLPHFAGTIAFLPAWPWEKDPGIELDVITGHHPEYYQSGDPNRIATDTEEPVPVIFPAVKPGQTWVFLLHPTARAQSTHLQFSRTWLAQGLETFGLGAKTNAGYGWFDASEELNNSVRERIEQKKRDDEKAARDRAEKDRHDREQDDRRKEKQALQQALEGLTPEDQEDKKMELMNDGQFDAKVRAFCKEPKRGGPSESEKGAIVRALRKPRLTYWQTFKSKATKGDLAAVAQAINALNKQLNGDKMP